MAGCSVPYGSSATPPFGQCRTCTPSSSGQV